MKQSASPKEPQKTGSVGFLRYQPIGPLEAALPFLRTKSTFFTSGCTSHTTALSFLSSTLPSDSTFLLFLSFQGTFYQAD